MSIPGRGDASKTDGGFHVESLVDNWQRQRPIRSTFQLLRQFVQPLLHPVLFDVREGLAIYSCCSAVGFAAFLGKCHPILSVHLVVRSIKLGAPFALSCNAVCNF